MRVLLNDGTSMDISEEDILYFSHYKNTIYVHTKEGEFVLPTTLSDLCTAYESRGFERLDRSNVVNMNNISGYDDFRKVVTFESEDGYATVSESNEARVKRFLSKLRSKLQEYPAVLSVKNKTNG